MRYSVKKINSDSKRYVTAKVFDAELWSVSSQGEYTSIIATVHDPRTPSGEGLRVNLDFGPEDMHPLMAAFIGRLYGMLTPELRDEFDRDVKRTIAECDKLR
jgi:hypothetical protein